MPDKCVYQGEPGAYSEACAADVFSAAGRPVELIGLSSFDEVFSSLAQGNADYAAVPVENTLGGSIHINYDLLLRYHGQVHILGEHVHRVRHTLLALPGVRKEDIRKAMSHPQALAQTDNYLRTAGIMPVPAYDTAGAAKLVREQGLRDTAAIASARAADVHGLCVLDAGIEDDTNNFTRFLLLGRVRPTVPEGVPAKTSVVFVPHVNEAGALFKALSVFAVREIDLSKIESRPYRPGSFGAAVPNAGSAAVIASSEGPPAKRSRTEANGDVGCGPGGTRFQYAFYIDLLAGRGEERCVNALRHLREMCAYCWLLGCFPQGGVAFESAGPDESAAVCHPAAVLRESPLRVAIVGFGTFGQFLARRWVLRGHTVLATSRTDYSALAKEMGVAFYGSLAELAAQEVDVVLISTSIMSFEAVLRSLPESLTRGRLVVDVLSVKSHAKTTMLRVLPADVDLLCMHPMFGPESGRDGWHALPCVYEQVRVADHHRGARCLALFEEEGCKMVKMSCEKHDQLAAGSQFVTHLTGRLLSQLGLQPSPIATQGYRALLQLVDNTCKDSFDLFYALYSHNPASSQTLDDFASAFDQVRADLLGFGSRPATSAASAAPLRLSRRVAALPLSKTAQVSDLAISLKQRGVDLVSLSVGEPDFAPAAEVLDAAHAALKAGKVKYTEMGGTRELREAICADLARRKGLQYGAEQVVVSSGAKQSIVQAMLALVGPRDEVLIPAPYWVSYPSMTMLCGATSKVIRTTAEHGYTLQPAALEAAITPASRLLILCNPSNPTGAVHPRGLLEQIAEVVARHPNLLVLSDEIYEQITFDEDHVAFATLPGMLERTITINGFSKGAAMTGFRVGYLAAPLAIAKACAKVQSQNTSCPSSISQHAAVAALKDVPDAFLSEAVATFRTKRDFVLARLRAIPHVSCPTPEGAFYVFPRVSAYFGSTTAAGKTLPDAESLCLYLLEEWHVALVPGEAFGDPACFRISYATGMSCLTTAMERIERGLNALSRPDGNGRAAA